MRISLNDAFHMMGNKIYGPSWVKSCINLSPGKLRAIDPEECLHFPDLEHPEDDIERQRTGIQIASFDQMICYETVRDGLYKDLWNKEIKARLENYLKTFHRKLLLGRIMKVVEEEDDDEAFI